LAQTRISGEGDSRQTPLRREVPHPEPPLRSASDLSPQAGRGERLRAPPVQFNALSRLSCSWCRRLSLTVRSTLCWLEPVFRGPRPRPNRRSAHRRGCGQSSRHSIARCRRRAAPPSPRLGGSGPLRRSLCQGSFTRRHRPRQGCHFVPPRRQPRDARRALYVVLPRRVAVVVAVVVVGICAWLLNHREDDLRGGKVDRYRQLRPDRGFRRRLFDQGRRFIPLQAKPVPLWPRATTSMS